MSMKVTFDESSNTYSFSLPRMLSEREEEHFTERLADEIESLYEYINNMASTPEGSVAEGTSNRPAGRVSGYGNGYGNGYNSNRRSRRGRKTKKARKTKRT